MAPHFEAAARLLDECDSPCLEKRMHTFRMEVQKENLLVSDMLVQGSSCYVIWKIYYWIGAILYRVLIFSWNFFSIQEQS